VHATMVAATHALTSVLRRKRVIQGVDIAPHTTPKPVRGE
jgi:hypothetical protein